MWLTPDDHGWSCTKAPGTRRSRWPPTAGDEAHIRKPLKEIDDGLDGERLWHVHCGVIVRADAIARAQHVYCGR